MEVRLLGCLAVRLAQVKHTDERDGCAIPLATEIFPKPLTLLANPNAQLYQFSMDIISDYGGGVTVRSVEQVGAGVKVSEHDAREFLLRGLDGEPERVVQPYEASLGGCVGFLQSN